MNAEDAKDRALVILHVEPGSRWWRKPERTLTGWEASITTSVRVLNTEMPALGGGYSVEYMCGAVGYRAAPMLLFLRSYRRYRV